MPFVGFQGAASLSLIVCQNAQPHSETALEQVGLLACIFGVTEPDGTCAPGRPRALVLNMQAHVSARQCMHTRARPCEVVSLPRREPVVRRAERQRDARHFPLTSATENTPGPPLPPLGEFPSSPLWAAVRPPPRAATLLQPS